MAELKKNLLRECPFCGGEAEHEVFNDGFFTLGRVECKQCKAMLTTPPVNTINAWNNRVTEAEIRAKAIDEFAEKLRRNFRDIGAFTGYEVKTWINEIAEQLKGNEE